MSECIFQDFKTGVVVFFWGGRGGERGGGEGLWLYCNLNIEFKIISEKKILSLKKIALQKS